jgi:hypothetical protein
LYSKTIREFNPPQKKPHLFKVRFFALKVSKPGSVFYSNLSNALTLGQSKEDYLRPAFLTGTVQFGGCSGGDCPFQSLSYLEIKNLLSMFCILHKKYSPDLDKKSFLLLSQKVNSNCVLITFRHETPALTHLGGFRSRITPSLLSSAAWTFLPAPFKHLIMIHVLIRLIN